MQVLTPNIHLTAVCFLLLALQLLIAPTTNAASLQDVPGSEWGSAGLNTTVEMKIYVPDNVVENPPVLLALHQCGGTGPFFFYDSQSNVVADQYGFIVIVPSTMDSKGNYARCWDNGSRESLTRYGRADSEAVIRMVKYTLDRYHANPNRVYALGGSSGAMMVETMLGVYPEVFKAGVGFAGVTCGADGWGDNRNLTPQQWGDIARAITPGYSGPYPRIQLWHGTTDPIVSYKNLGNSAKQYSNLLGLDEAPTSTTEEHLLNVQNTFIHQVWQNACGDTLIDAYSEVGGNHGSDAWKPVFWVPFLGLDVAGPDDPIMPCDGNCNPTAITPYVQVDDGDWQQTESVTVDAGATAKFGPQPTSGGSWSWSGCGTSGSSREQTISPTDSCTITATYTNSCGEQSTQNFTVNINSVGNQPPVASTSGPYSAMIGATVQFDASSSTDADGSIASYSWSFGDGSMGTGVKPTHSYSSKGTYNVTLTVTDNDNAMDSVITNVNINPANQPPIADLGKAYSAKDGEAVMFDGSASSDPDGSIASYAWNFGDTVTSTEMNPSHTYAAAGSYTVSLTVTDNQGLTGTAMTSVTIGSVNMQAPDAQANGPYSGSVAVPIDFNGSRSNDPDGTIVSYEWDFGDGNKMTDSSNSTSHAYSQSGSYTVTLKVTDNDGLMDMETTTATIGMGNMAPVAEASGAYNGKVNGVIKFDGSQSHDQDGSIVNYIWDFGDGTGDSGSNPYPEHSYASVGTYNVILTVTDNTGAMDSDMTTVSVTSEGTDTGGSDKSSGSSGAASVSFLFILTIALSLFTCGRKEFLERDEVN